MCKQTETERRAELAKADSDMLIFGTSVLIQTVKGGLQHVSLDRVQIDGIPAPKKL